jgi:hypothetical protein
MPRVHIDVDLKLTTDTLGFDVLTIHARHLPPRTAFTTFLSSRRQRRLALLSTSVTSPPTGMATPPTSSG